MRTIIVTCDKCGKELEGDAWLFTSRLTWTDPIGTPVVFECCMDCVDEARAYFTGVKS